MKPSLRSITSLAMAVLYLLIIGLPLAPLATHSRQVVQAVTGECSGDCSICGCAPERSAARACCWQHKRAKERQALQAPAAKVAATTHHCQMIA